MKIKINNLSSWAANENEDSLPVSNYREASCNKVVVNEPVAGSGSLVLSSVIL